MNPHAPRRFETCGIGYIAVLDGRGTVHFALRFRSASHLEFLHRRLARHHLLRWVPLGPFHVHADRNGVRVVRARLRTEGEALAFSEVVCHAALVYRRLAFCLDPFGTENEPPGLGEHLDEAEDFLLSLEEE